MRPISATLDISNDVKSAKPLKANDGICSPVIKTFGAGFIIESKLAQRWIAHLTSQELAVLKPYYGGKDITDRWKGKYVIDVDHLEEDALRRDYPTFYSHIFNHVKPERDENNEESRRLQWWKFGRRNTELRGALAGCERFIVTTETAKHRFFVFLEPPQFPEGGLVVVGSCDAILLGHSFGAKPIWCGCSERRARSRRGLDTTSKDASTLSLSPLTSPNRSRPASAPRPRHSTRCASRCWPRTTTSP